MKGKDGTWVVQSYHLNLSKCKNEDDAITTLQDRLPVSSERMVKMQDRAIRLILNYYQTESIDESQRGISDWPTDDVDEYVEE